MLITASTWTWILVGSVALGILLYVSRLRAWQLTFGATDEEARAMLPGDEQAKDAQVKSTRAITVQAPARALWPWLVQMGQQRGGFYSYAWMENLAGCRISNVDRIVPAWQDLAVGDEVRLHPRSPPLKVVQLTPERSLVLEGGEGAFVWSFTLQERRDGSTRLLVRSQAHLGEGLWARLGTHLLLEPVHFLMEQRMLRGLRDRAERSDRASSKGPRAPPAPRVGASEVAPPPADA